MGTDLVETAAAAQSCEIIMLLMLSIGTMIQSCWAAADSSQDVVVVVVVVEASSSAGAADW